MDAQHELCAHTAWSVRPVASLACTSPCGRGDRYRRCALPVCAGKRNLGDITCAALSEAVAANTRWLEECVMLLLCVLSLDRFADYGSDQVCACVCVRVCVCAYV